MATTTLPTFLRDRRERLSPPSGARRRTPGLRREEVAARAGVSVTWYTWLEQGRGGAPSEDVLERLARALELDDPLREVLFLLAQGRPPPRKAAAPAIVTPALRLLLDSIAVPAYLKTPTSQVVAWNPASVAVLGDYADVPERERNMLRRIFASDAHTKVHDVEAVRRAHLAFFRVDLARAGQSAEATALIDELLHASPEFRRLWADAEMRQQAGFQKRITRPGVGEIVLEASVLHVEGAAGLSLLVLTPVDAASKRAVEQLVRREVRCTRSGKGGRDPQGSNG